MGKGIITNKALIMRLLSDGNLSAKMVMLKDYETQYVSNTIIISLEEAERNGYDGFEEDLWADGSYVWDFEKEHELTWTKEENI